MSTFRVQRKSTFFFRSHTFQIWNQEPHQTKLLIEKWFGFFRWTFITFFLTSNNSRRQCWRLTLINMKWYCSYYFVSLLIRLVSASCVRKSTIESRMWSFCPSLRLSNKKWKNERIFFSWESLRKMSKW